MRAWLLVFSLTFTGGGEFRPLRFQGDSLGWALSLPAPQAPILPEDDGETQGSALMRVGRRAMAFLYWKRSAKAEDGWIRFPRKAVKCGFSEEV